MSLTINQLLLCNSYPGRGIIIGKTLDGTHAVSAYFIMGRSENSRNRIFSEKNGEVTIYPHDVSKVKDPSLIIYSPVRKYKNHLIVTNGDQTDTVFDFLTSGKTFEDALNTRTFEPDEPNFTPRISGIVNFSDGGFNYKLSILKSGDGKGNGCNRFYFTYTPINGVGHFIHTYDKDGLPLPSFTGEPKEVEITNDIDEFATLIWNSLNGENKISLFVRFDNLTDGTFACRTINKHLPEDVK